MHPDAAFDKDRSDELYADTVATIVARLGEDKRKKRRHERSQPRAGGPVQTTARRQRGSPSKTSPPLAKSLYRVRGYVPQHDSDVPTSPVQDTRPSPVASPRLPPREDAVWEGSSPPHEHYVAPMRQPKPAVQFASPVRQGIQGHAYPVTPPRNITTPPSAVQPLPEWAQAAPSTPDNDPEEDVERSAIIRRDLLGSTSAGLRAPRAASITPPPSPPEPPLVDPPPDPPDAPPDPPSPLPPPFSEQAAPRKASLRVTFDASPTDMAQPPSPHSPPEGPPSHAPPAEYHVDPMDTGQAADQPDLHPIPSFPVLRRGSGRSTDSNVASPSVHVVRLGSLSEGSKAVDPTPPDEVMSEKMETSSAVTVSSVESPQKNAQSGQHRPSFLRRQSVTFDNAVQRVSLCESATPPKLVIPQADYVFPVEGACPTPTRTSRSASHCLVTEGVSDGASELVMSRRGSLADSPAATPRVVRVGSSTFEPAQKRRPRFLSMTDKKSSWKGSDLSGFPHRANTGDQDSQSLLRQKSAKTLKPQRKMCHDNIALKEAFLECFVGDTNFRRNLYAATLREDPRELHAMARQELLKELCQMRHLGWLIGYFILACSLAVLIALNILYLTTPDRIGTSDRPVLAMRWEAPSAFALPSLRLAAQCPGATVAITRCRLTTTVEPHSTSCLGGVAGNLLRPPTAPTSGDTILTVTVSHTSSGCLDGGLVSFYDAAHTHPDYPQPLYVFPWGATTTYHLKRSIISTASHGEVWRFDAVPAVGQYAGIPNRTAVLELRDSNAHTLFIEERHGVYYPELLSLVGGCIALAWTVKALIEMVAQFWLLYRSEFDETEAWLDLEGQLLHSRSVVGNKEVTLGRGAITACSCALLFERHTEAMGIDDYNASCEFLSSVILPIGYVAQRYRKGKWEDCLIKQRVDGEKYFVALVRDRGEIALKEPLPRKQLRALHAFTKDVLDGTHINPHAGRTSLNSTEEGEGAHDDSTPDERRDSSATAYSFIPTANRVPGHAGTMVSSPEGYPFGRPSFIVPDTAGTRGKACQD